MDLNMDIQDIAERAQSIKLPIDEARHLPGEVYADQNVFALEVENVFRKDWLVLCREEELANNGDYKTFRLFGDAILACRDRTGELQVFYNSCRHRGVEVAAGVGNRKSFSCPYHGWVYGLDGDLIGAPMMNMTKIGKCSLPQLRFDTWGGFIFVNFDADAIPLRSWIGTILNKMDVLQPQNCRVIDTTVLELDCNWKLIVENLLDGYHVGVLHADTLGKDWDPSKLTMEMLGLGASYMEAEMGTVTPDGVSLFGKMPWLGAGQEKFSNLLTLPPNTVLIGRYDMIFAFVALPVAADKTIVTMSLLIPEAFVNDPKIDEKAKIYGDYGRLIFAEDGDMLLSLQNNFSMKTYRPGPMNAMEGTIKHFLSAHVDRIFENRALV